MAMANRSSRECQDQVQAETKASTSSGVSNYYTPHSCTMVPSGASSITDLKLTLFPSMYYSTRIESMMESRNKLGNGLDFEIEASKTHWTQADHSTSDMEYSSDSENSVESDREYFEILKQHPQWANFFKEFPDMVIGEKIAEGGQAEIYAASFKSKRRYHCQETGCKDYLDIHNVERFKDGRKYHYVVKVFKGGIPLRFLQSQWPRGMLSAGHFRDGPLVSIMGGTLLKDKRLKDKFAFVMSRRVGDLRKLIGERMLENGNKGITAPFNEAQVKRLMYKIAKDMGQLHQEYGILHKDLKAANVLLSLLDDERDSSSDEVHVVVADFECSMGVVGTGFWRAPEILQQLRNRVLSSKLVFTSQVDVYSYGMTYYEIVTGCIPFESESFSNYDIILSGARPKLPSDTDPFVRDIITSCWKDNPMERPTFQEIEEKICSKLY